ncbi:uroporphyrinogen-III C-methyltransferase [uncultured Microbulbifer sp.]|uniref:uroporphyrinogen-III C-methyltransferase n=1 Tax=uncultured Microbulbifer sp. TaxID=348147 RepID=UPI00262F89AF|nr:uroporphyrinogen-III C-methyltransferase [uncultured Microbulbifer sp.]
MTNEKSKDNASTPAGDLTADTLAKQESKSNFAKATQGKKKDKPPQDATLSGKSGGRWWWLVFILLLIALIAFAWHSWPQLRNRIAQFDFPAFKQTASPRETDRQGESSAPNTTAQPPVDTTPAEPVSNAEPSSDSAPSEAQPPHPSVETTTSLLNQQLDQLQQADTTLRNQIQLQARTIAQLQQQLAGMQRSMTAQGNRLSELGNVSREDWQLAEADYLLRMANQRLMLEDNSSAALGLVEKVDTILRQVNLPDLYGVRQQLARDITALKLVENIDREGLYLRLRALEEQLIRARIQPEFDIAHSQAQKTQEEPAQEGQTPWQRSWRRFTTFLRDSVRPIDGDINPVMLSPQSETRFRQTLRLNMEQAQLALLRGDSTVYKDALNSARELLLTYGTANTQRNALAQQLAELSEKPIQAQMPDLNASQVALYNYIELLHKTSGHGADTPGGGNP